MENHMSSGNKIHTANILAGATSFLAFILWCGFRDYRKPLRSVFDVIGDHVGASGLADVAPSYLGAIHFQLGIVGQ